jgi:hypothetical protein
VKKDDGIFIEYLKLIDYLKRYVISIDFAQVSTQKKLLNLIFSSYWKWGNGILITDR